MTWPACGGKSDVNWGLKVSFGNGALQGSRFRAAILNLLTVLVALQTLLAFSGLLSAL